MCELDRFLISRYNDGQRPEVRNSSKCQVVDVIWWFAVANVRLFVFGCTVPFTKRNSFYAPARVKQTSRANRFPIRALVRDRRYQIRLYALESPPSNTAQQVFQSRSAGLLQPAVPGGRSVTRQWNRNTSSPGSGRQLPRWPVIRPEPRPAAIQMYDMVTFCRMDFL
jgi:hypothetical protein